MMGSTEKSQPDGAKYLDQGDIEKALTALKSSTSRLTPRTDRSINFESTKAASSVSQAKFSEVSRLQCQSSQSDSNLDYRFIAARRIRD
jgi:hypothetical protein